MSSAQTWRRRIIVFLILLAAGVALRFIVFRPDPVPVTVFRVAEGRVEATVVNSKAGTVKTRRRASLSTEIGGRVARLPARKGDRVRRGDVLVRLADEDLEAQLRLQERSLEAAVAGERAACLEAEQAVRDHQRQVELAREQIVSEDILERFRSRREVAAAACEEAAARVQQSGAAVDAARAAAAKAVLRAPFDGVVADLRTEVGEWITPSPPGVPLPAVIDLLDPEAIYVSAPLDEVDVGKVKVGQAVRVTMDSYPGQEFEGRLVRVAPYVLDVEEQNRTFEVEVELADPAFARTLLPGTSADVEVIRERREGVLRIPSYALMEGSRVLVVRGEALEEVPVETGLRNWEFTEISAGLKTGEAVVVSLDRVEVKAGARARIQGETLR